MMVLLLLELVMLAGPCVDVYVFLHFRVRANRDENVWAEMRLGVCMGVMKMTMMCAGSAVVGILESRTGRRWGALLASALAQEVPPRV